MIKYTKKDLKDILRKELKKYKAEIGSITPEEQKELHEWVAAENSPYDNPYWLYGDNGYPMDFIDAMRTDEDMRINPGDYNFGGLPDDVDYDTIEF